jgi:archaeoflavoprotein AfpA
MTLEIVMEKNRQKKKRKVAWGITGSGDKIVEIVEVMKKIKQQYQNEVTIIAYLSKAGEQVAKWYKLAKDLNEHFNRIYVEKNSNLPFLAGELQTGKFEFLLIAPATSNTVAKISLGIGDSLLCNAAIMGLKAFVPCYVMPSDYQEGEMTTKLPNGRALKLRVRKEDVENVKKLVDMKDVFILEKPDELYQVFKKHFRIQALDN